MKYSDSYNPPAPSLNVRFSRPSSTRSLEIQAKLDTGADITVIPQQIINELRLMPVRRISISSFDKRQVWKYTYFVDLSLKNLEFSMVEVISTSRLDALLGRDVLNLLKTTLDGKTLNFDLHDP